MQVQERLYPNAICGTNPGLLAAIHEKENSIAIYEREIQSLNRDLSDIMDKEVMYKACGNLYEIALELDAYFKEHLPECEVLKSDIRDLVHLFDTVVNGGSYRLLLTTVHGNMCRKFHTDINDLRLLCTYVGEGTLWVSEDEGNRIADVELPISPKQIHQAQAGDVIILKGALHPEGNPVLHRSPAIAKTGGKRLLLRIDTNNQFGL